MSLSLRESISRSQTELCRITQPARHPGEDFSSSSISFREVASAPIRRMMGYGTGEGGVPSPPMVNESKVARSRCGALCGRLGVGRNSFTSRFGQLQAYVRRVGRIYMTGNTSALKRGTLIADG